MIRYIIKRLLMMIPVVLGVAILIFTIMYFTPGDPAVMTLGSEATAEDIEQQRINLGLDQPYIVQLGNFLSQVFIHGDFGTSYMYRVNVTSELWQRFPRTLPRYTEKISTNIRPNQKAGIDVAIREITIEALSQKEF